jgi:hypothetical protein
MSERMTAEELIDGLKLIRDRFAVGVTHRRKIMNAAIDHLRASQTPDLTWFWEIVDRHGPQGLPSCEAEALRILINSYRANQTPPQAVTLTKDVKFLQDLARGFAINDDLTTANRLEEIIFNLESLSASPTEHSPGE